MANYKDIKYDYPASAITSGTFADDRISQSSVSQHATSFDDNKIVNDISTLALRQASDNDKAAYSTNSSSVDVFQDATGIDTSSGVFRNVNEYMSSAFTLLASATVYSGNNGRAGNNSNPYWAGGGGGSSTSSTSENGGQGVQINIDGNNYYWGGGGGGNGYNARSGGEGGLGGGGGGAGQYGQGAGIGDTNGINNASNGQSGGSEASEAGGNAGANTGGGGGGGGWPGGTSGAGGSGIVMVRFTTSEQSGYTQTGGSASTVSGTDTLISYTTTSGTKNFTAGASGTIQVLIVGGGGSGGGSMGGGGGAGEVIHFTSYPVEASTTYSITVGAGGATTTGTGNDGSSSIFGNQTATGGGGGAAGTNSTGRNGANGGGGTGGGGTGSSSSISVSNLSGTNATGNFTGTTITADSSVSSMGAIITYQDNAGTNALNTDIVLQLSADGGSNYSTATLTALPDFSTGIKMAKVNDLAVTAGTSLKYKISFANQASGSKEARIRGVSLQY